MTSERVQFGQTFVMVPNSPRQNPMMKRIALVAAMIAASACNNAAKEQARLDSIAADSTAKAAAAEMQRVADSTKAADSIKAAASKTKAKAPGTKSKM